LTPELCSGVAAKLKRIANESQSIQICDLNNSIPFIDDDELINRKSYIINTDYIGALLHDNFQSRLKDPKVGQSFFFLINFVFFSTCGDYTQSIFGN
jgi:hypothetical protein